MLTFKNEVSNGNNLQIWYGGSVIAGGVRWYERRKIMEEILNHTEKAYENMERVANMLTALSPNGARYIVDETYLDYGQDWKWTTIIRKRYNECQVLYPSEWKRIVEVENPRDLLPIVNDIINDKNYGDN